MAVGPERGSVFLGLGRKGYSITCALKALDELTVCSLMVCSIAKKSSECDYELTVLMTHSLRMFQLCYAS